MEVAFTEYVAVTDSTSVGEVRRTALLLAQRLNFDETRSGEFALLATEVSRNVLVHGGGGEVVLTGIKEQDASTARILAMDKGPGIANMAHAMMDGYSTAGTMGGGMGAMKRIANKLDVFSGREGTIVLLQIGPAPPTEQLQVAGLAVPYPGERVCGDAWTFHSTPERMVSMVVDGLGHGWEASEAAQEAVAIFRKRIESGPGQILSYVHEALKKTRGAVAAIAEIRPREGYPGVRRRGEHRGGRAEPGRVAKPGLPQRDPGRGDLEDPGVQIGMALGRRAGGALRRAAI